MIIPTHEVSNHPGMPSLVWAYAFDAGCNARPLEVQSLNAVRLQSLRAEGNWLWLHFNTSDARTVQAISSLDLPEAACETLLSHDTHVSLQLEGTTAFGVFVDWCHQRGTDPDKRSFVRDDQEVGWMHFAVGQGLVVSARRQALRSVEQVRQHVAGGVTFDSETDLLEGIVSQFAASVAHATLELGEQLDRIEDRVLADSIGEERRDLALLRRRAVTMHRPLTALRRVLRQFEQRHGVSTHPLVPAAARLSQHFDELDSHVATLHERARLLQDEVAAKLAEQTNRHLFVLSVVTALLLPPTLVVGVFGMNMGNLPLIHSTHGFGVAMGLCVASSVFVYVLLRRFGVGR
ncbi:MAG: CorA family divalent cation transporter [Pseudoxanthomonas sp.]